MKGCAAKVNAGREAADKRVGVAREREHCMCCIKFSSVDVLRRTSDKKDLQQTVSEAVAASIEKTGDVVHV